MDYINWLRSRVGHSKVILVFSSVALRDSRGRLLLQRRGDFDAWGLPGGVLELGEDIRTCAHRELFEETGLTSGELELVGVYSEPDYDILYPNGDQAQQYSVCFQCQVDGGELRADGVESRAVRFFEPDEIPMPEVPPWYRAMIGDALRADLPAFTAPTARQELKSRLDVLRGLLGDEPFIAAGASAAITRQDGCILMVHQRDSGQWSIPTGYLYLGENAAHTAQRVALYETGLKVDPQRILDVYSPVELWSDPAGGLVQPVISLFECRVSGASPGSSAAETSRTAWVPLENLLKLPTEPPQLELHRALVSCIQARRHRGLDQH